MKLRELLELAEAQITDDFTQEKLLDTDIKVRVHAATGTYDINTGVAAARFEVEKRYGHTQKDMIPATVEGLPSLVLDTTMVP